MHVYPTVKLFGVSIASLSLTEISNLIIQLIVSKGKKIFCYVNAHCLNIANKDKDYRRILNKATLVYSGGIGPVLASRILGKPLRARTTTPDFIESIFAVAQEKNWSFYFVGAREGITQKAGQAMRKKFPKLKIVGCQNGYFRKEEEARIIHDINQKKPTVILIGMGVPKQEKWIEKNFDKLNAHVFWSVGALFDILSGEVARAPRWMGNIGLVWLFRLFQEPSRLWRRYTIGNLTFIYSIIVSLLKEVKPDKIFGYRS